jgi:pyridoxal phosphate enzyme (YggS family)
LIGHLQSNKSRIAAELFQVIETVDSEKLAKRLDQIVVPARPLPDGRGSIGSLEPSASASGQPLEVMIEVKLSHEESKEGAPPDSLPALIAAIRACPNLSLTGLMTMPPWCDDPEVTRPYFRELASLARLHGLTKLSMGMSHDLEAAIEEGSTHVRVGTALFGPRKKD